MSEGAVAQRPLAPNHPLLFLRSYTRFLRAFLAHCSRPSNGTMFGTFLKAWLPISDVPTAAPAEHQADPEPLLGSSLSLCYSTLAESLKIAVGRCNCLSTAMLALRMTQALAHSDPTISPLTRTGLAQLFDQMQAVEALQLHAGSFSGKTVVVLEGLPGVGKSTIAQRLSATCAGLCVLDPTQTEAFRAMEAVLHSPSAAQQPLQNYLARLLQFLLSYAVAAQAAQSTAPAVLVEQLHHAFVAQHLGLNEQDQVQESAFAWPIDLPTPELVLYFSCPTELRQHRLGTQLSVEEQLRAQAAEAVYSRIRGPGTVGIDAGASVEDVHATVLQALDYFGVYSISRATTTAAAVAPSPVSALDLEEPHAFSTSGVAENDENQDCSNWAWDQPEAPQHIIKSRRSSIGVYGMYSRIL